MTPPDLADLSAAELAVVARSLGLEEHAAGLEAALVRLQAANRTAVATARTELRLHGAGANPHPGGLTALANAESLSVTEDLGALHARAVDACRREIARREAARPTVRRPRGRPRSQPTEYFGLYRKAIAAAPGASDAELAQRCGYTPGSFARLKRKYGRPA